MKLRTGFICVALALALCIPCLSDYNPYGSTANSSESSISVFAVTDTQNAGGGFGASLTTNKGSQITDLSYVSAGSYKLVQTGAMSPNFLGGSLPIAGGVAVAYVNPSSGNANFSSGFLTGFEVGLGTIKTDGGLSFTVKASALSTNLNPYVWITNPNILWLGAGVSYSF